MKNNKEATLKKWGELLDKMGLNDVSTTKINIVRILESDASKLLKEEMEKNNIISDWIDKYGDPEIEKKVGMKLEEMNKERFNQIIDEVYKNYLNEWTFEKYPNDGSVYSVEPIKVKVHSKEQFVYRCKTDSEFSEEWGLKIEERELSEKERMNTLIQNEQRLIYEEVQSFKNVRKKKIKDCLDERNVPTKLITLEYNGTKIEVYE